MTPINRREVLAASGLAASALAGCLARDGDGGGEQDGGDQIDVLPGEVATALEPIPAGVEGTAVRYVYLMDPDARERVGRGTVPSGFYPDLGLERSQLDRVATALYGRSGRSVSTYVGSFGANDVSSDSYAVASAWDGLAVAASTGESGWTPGLDAATAAKDDPSTGIEASYPVEPLFDPVTDHRRITAVPDLRGGMAPEGAEIDVDAVEAIATGTTPDFEAMEQTVTLVVVFADGFPTEAGVVEEIVRTSDADVDPDTLDVTVGDGRATATITDDLPRRRLPDDSPNAWFGFRYDQEAETVTIVHEGGDAVDASNLELRVEGERVAAPWPDEGTIEPRDGYEIDVRPTALVRVVWVDPNIEDVAHSLDAELVGIPGAFERTYDPEADELTISYTGEPTLEADGFVVSHWNEGAGVDAERRPLAEYAASLRTGDAFVLSDVQYGAGVRLLYEPEGDPSFPPVTVFWFEVAERD